jgi:hypothetical protein
MYLLKAITSPIIFKGTDNIGFRDPTAIYHDGIFRLFFTYNEIEEDGTVYMYTAMSKSKDLIHWSTPKILTSKDRHLNFSSPGNIIHYKDKWIMCLQTYPRPNGEKYGNADARIWTMTSEDLEDWDKPVPLMVKGNETPLADMGRMIDPYLLHDGEIWWCIYKQNGVSLSFSYDMKKWTYAGSHDAGENVCILLKDDEYWMFHSPKNGIGIMKSKDLLEWENVDLLLTLGQADWNWAKGRLTAGFVLDATGISGVHKYLMFFHGTGPDDEETIFDQYACIGIAWSDDLITWEWPRKKY